MTKRVAFEKLKKYQKVICIVLLYATVDSALGKFSGASWIFGTILFFFWDYITTPLEIRKQNVAARRFRSSSSGSSLDLGDTLGFTNPASPLYHQHNSPSISSTFESHRW